MKFEKRLPTERLKPYVQHFILSEQDEAHSYKVFPSPGLVVGFQFKGQLSLLHDNQENRLAFSGITGISDCYKSFRNEPGTGTVLVYFTETGFAHFASHPAHELFNLSVSLDDLFSKSSIGEVEDKLASATTDLQRIQVVECFLLSKLKEIQQDRLIIEALRLIYESRGAIRIKELNKRLLISPSALEKRFRKLVGTTPKKFASIVRFNAVLGEIDRAKSLTELGYGHHFFDQAHFIRDFKQYTGETPEKFRL